MSHDPLNVTEESRNWTEDFEYDNGQYYNVCHTCNSAFMGYKGRVTCRDCATDHRPLTTDHRPLL